VCLSLTCCHHAFVMLCKPYLLVSPQHTSCAILEHTGVCHSGVIVTDTAPSTKAWPFCLHLYLHHYLSTCSRICPATLLYSTILSFYQQCMSGHCCCTGRLPLSMTSQAYGQEVTEQSHTALMRSKLLQQMDMPSGTGQQHLSFKHSSSSSQAASHERFSGGEGCLQPPLRGSGHHHYLPFAGETQCQCNCLYLPFLS